MEFDISFITLGTIVINLILGMVGPSLLFSYCRKTFHGASKAFWTGMATVIFFVYFLESVVHDLILPTSFGEIIQGNVILSALYGAVLAVIFQEGGKWFAFRKLLRTEFENDGNALMYAAGHGSFEWMYGLIFGMMGNFMLARNLYVGNAEALLFGLEGAELDSAVAALTALCAANPLSFFIAPLERILALIIQTSVTVLIWLGLRQEKEGRKLVALAVGIRFAVEMLAGILSAYLTLFHLELVMMVIAVFTGMYAYKIWQEEAFVWEPEE